MKSVFRGCAAILPVAAIASVASPAFAAEGTIGSENPFTYVIVGGVACATLIAMLLIRSSLSGSNWSLSDALSEETEVTPLDKDGQPLFRSPDGAPQKISELRASTSRFIAMMGLIAILMMYLGFGLVLIKDLAVGTGLPDDKQFNTVSTFLFAGVTMFAPYVINKFSSVFDWLKPK